MGCTQSSTKIITLEYIKDQMMNLLIILTRLLHLRYTMTKKTFCQERVGNSFMKKIKNNFFVIFYILLVNGSNGSKFFIMFPLIFRHFITFSKY